MGLTITEKIFREHTKDKRGVAGEFILADIDKCLANDITAPIAIKVFEEIIKGTEKTFFNSESIILTPDHFTPNKDVESAEQSKILKTFAHKYNISNYFRI